MSAYHGRDFSRDWLRENSLDIENKDVYCFGIYTGWSCGQVGYDFKSNNLKPNAFWGFDSFEGLPEEKEGMYIHPDWKKGAFDSRKLSGIQNGINFNDGNFIENIKNNFNERSGYHIDMIKGFFSESLTDELVKEKNMKPACFVDMDVDIYISTYESMDWMARNGLIQNTLFYFDDWFNAKEPYTFGEALAMKEICDKYKYKYKKLWELDNGTQSVFLLNF